MVHSFLPSLPQTLALLQALFGKLCISGGFSVIYIHSSEIFPTSMRNTAMGLVSIASRWQQPTLYYVYWGKKKETLEQLVAKFTLAISVGQLSGVLVSSSSSLFLFPSCPVSIARSGAILAPFLTQLGDLSTDLHFVVFGGLAFSSAVLNTRLPETKGMPLPETVEDLLKRWKR